MSIRITLLAATAAFLLAGCASPFGGGATPPHVPPSGDDRPTVRVENEGLATVAIYEQGHSARIGTVQPGQTTCVRLTNGSASRRLIARPVGGGEPTISPVFDTGRGEGWSWSLANIPNLDRLSLQPAEPCA